jgi:hypothetical protein
MAEEKIRVHARFDRLLPVNRSLSLNSQAPAQIRLSFFLV